MPQALVIGAGLAGAACAHTLALRGFAVTVLETQARIAAHASSAPVGLMAPHASAHEVPLSQLSRLGVIETLKAAQTLLRAGLDWQPSGALQLARLKAAPPPERWPREAGWFAEHEQGLWHARAAWIKPARLVRAWLAHPAITVCTNSPVTSLQRARADAASPDSECWQLLDLAGQEIARAPLVVIAASNATVGLLQNAGLGPKLVFDQVAGQVLTGPWTAELAALLPAYPVNGRGHFLPAIASDTPGGPAFWLAGASYERELPDLRPSLESAWQKNLPYLTALLSAQALAVVTRQYQQGDLSVWGAYRCTTSDRMPVVGAVAPGLCLNTALGSRGLSFALLCAQLLAAQACGDPEPWPPHLVAAVSPHRFR